MEILGYIAILINIYVFYTISYKRHMVASIFSSSLIGIVYYFNNGFTGVLVIIYSLLFKIFILFFNKHTSFLFYFKFFIPVSSFIIWYFLFRTPQEILPIIGITFMLISQTFSKNILKMKYIQYGSVFSFFTYSCFLGSFSLMLFDVVGFVFLTASIYKIKSQEIKD